MEDDKAAAHGDAPSGNPGADEPLPGAVPGSALQADPAAVPSSAWIAPEPPRRGRSLLSTLATIGAVVVGLAVIAAIIGLNLRIFLPRGQILFGTAAGGDLCSVGAETRTVRAIDPVYFAAVLRHRMAGTDAIRLVVTHDGQPYFDHVEPADGTAFECYGSRESIGPLEPGVYVFEVFHDSELEASGTLRVT